MNRRLFCLVCALVTFGFTSPIWAQGPEAFVKTIKRDYVYLNDVSSARAVLSQLPAWFADYNENHPHKGLRMLSPRQFRRLRSA